MAISSYGPRGSWPTKQKDVPNASPFTGIRESSHPFKRKYVAFQKISPHWPENNLREIGGLIKGICTKEKKEGRGRLAFSEENVKMMKNMEEENWTQKMDEGMAEEMAKWNVQHRRTSGRRLNRVCGQGLSGHKRSCCKMGECLFLENALLLEMTGFSGWFFGVKIR
jgi:hypothetical protein